MKVYTSQPSKRQVSRLIKSGNGYSEKTAPFSTPSVNRFTFAMSESCPFFTIADQPYTLRHFGFGIAKTVALESPFMHPRNLDHPIVISTINMALPQPAEFGYSQRWLDRSGLAGRR